MTDKELKDTIVYIATTRTFTDSFCEEMGIDEEVAKGLADALIAAGIGDVKEAEHRAARAERALQIADELGELCGRKEDYVQQAEKELAEEEKNEQRNVNV